MENVSELQSNRRSKKKPFPLLLWLKRTYRVLKKLLKTMRMSIVWKDSRKKRPKAGTTEKQKSKNKPGKKADRIELALPLSIVLNERNSLGQTAGPL